jgi:hypothetical protein
MGRIACLELGLEVSVSIGGGVQHESYRSKCVKCEETVNQETLMASGEGVSYRTVFAGLDQGIVGICIGRSVDP